MLCKLDSSNYAHSFEQTPTLWVLCETNVRIQWNLVNKAFHRIRCCGNKTKLLVGPSHSDTILKRQTCGQRSGMAAASKHSALAFYFSVRIRRRCMFLISKWRGESDLGLCMTSGLAERMRPHSADFQFLNVVGRKIRQMSSLRSGILFARTEVMHTPRSDSSLHFEMINLQQIRTNK